MRKYRIVEQRQAAPPAWLVALIVGGIFGGLALAAWLERDTLSAEQRLYCDMVKMYKQDPSTGWPDYKGTYNYECKP